MTDQSNHQKAKSGSKTARRTAARLAAVQAYYQMLSNEQKADDVIEEFKMHRLGKPVDDNEMVLPDGVLFTKIVKGVTQRSDDLSSIIDTFLAARDSTKSSKTLESLETLLRSILLCGSFELLAHHDIDAPIIIADYLDISHAFFESGEAKLVNAALDHVNKAVR